MLVPEFSGGLGNMMFQMASIYSISKQTGHDFGILDIPTAPENHSKINYKENIFSKWEKYKTKKIPDNRISEQNLEVFNLEKLIEIPNSTVSTLYGYFQKETYLKPLKEEVLDLFDLKIDSSILEKYSDIGDAYFIHVRRGDYVGNSYHELDLKDYYKKAIKHIGKGIAYIVSNDIEWCKNWNLIKKIPHRFIEENDVDTLIIMSKCGLGGIAANSSYSWWGLYLDTKRPYLIIPSRWYPRDEIKDFGYKFEEATVIEVKLKQDNNNKYPIAIITILMFIFALLLIFYLSKY